MIGCRGCLKRLEVAAHAFGRKALPIELPHRSHFVARIAIDDSVRANEREPVLMLVDVVHRDLPAVDAVAQIALRSILPAMDIGVAILAVPAGIRENRIDVTLLAGHAGMHTPQRIGGPVVIEVGRTAQREPACGGVAVLAGYLQRPVWILGCRNRAADRTFCHQASSSSPQERHP